jgi:glyoxylase-like metal-dependent hydrolase (beta-lactamase superfamily II)
MITVKSFIFNPFQENTYVLSDQTGECVIIDAGCYTETEQRELVNYITNNKLKPVKQIVTHGHVDHVLGTAFVFTHYGLLPECHTEDVVLFNQSAEQGKMFGLQVPVLPSVKQFLTVKDPAKFGNAQLEILHVPGHSRGSVAFYSKNDQLVITGDVLFRDSIGRTDLFGGSYDELIDSIYNEILPLGDDVTVYPGHGPATTIGFERKNNAFLDMA